MSDTPKDGETLSGEFDGSGVPEKPDPYLTEFTVTITSENTRILTDWLQEKANQASYEDATPDDIFEMKIQALLIKELGAEEYNRRSSEYNQKQGELRHKFGMPLFANPDDYCCD